MAFYGPRSCEQVQFRLQQITEAPSEEKQLLLKELEEFASRGIPDVRGLLKDSVKKSLQVRTFL
jgi:hypothetical protein